MRGGREGADNRLSLCVNALAIVRGERTLFRDLSFEVRPGEALALLGRNGAGKTSLLRAIAGLLRPAAGGVRLAGLGDNDDRASALHFVGHQDGLKSARTAEEELRFWAGWFGGDEARVETALDRFDLRRLAGLEVRRLSAGQRRRLALARLVAAPRPLWLLDEPLAPLDAGWRERIGEVMTQHLAGGGSILAAVHDPLPISARELRIGDPA